MNGHAYRLNVEPNRPNPCSSVHSNRAAEVVVVVVVVIIVVVVVVVVVVGSHSNSGSSSYYIGNICKTQQYFSNNLSLNFSNSLQFSLLWAKLQSNDNENENDIER
ncbi:hypothetical protein GQX74_003247 [Glossina fuscipes]|nr:hypothetical protein GQX74_003247 [Glossina fuscipes]